MDSSSKSPFWVFNISKNEISLGDLGVSIPPKKYINLNNPIRYPYINQDLLLESKTKGSLFKYSKKILIMDKPLDTTNLKGASSIKIDENPNQITIKRAIVKIEEPIYEELQLSDEDYARENADLAELDSKNYKG